MIFYVCSRVFFGDKYIIFTSIKGLERYIRILKNMVYLKKKSTKNPENNIFIN